MFEFKDCSTISLKGKFFPNIPFRLYETHRTYHFQISLWAPVLLDS